MTALSSLQVSLVPLTGSATDTSQPSHFAAVSSSNYRFSAQTDTLQNCVMLVVFFSKFRSTLAIYGAQLGFCPDLAVSSGL